MQLEPGAVIGGKYRVERVLGEGGMGIVFEARHDALGTTVAVKVLRDEILKDKEAVARFAREARAAAALRSPHAARVLDVGEVAGAPFMVMELLVGNDLGVELERRGPLPVAEALQYVVQACEAIAEAHSLGIVHRDLKPANLFLTGTAPRRLVKVLDFGISRFDVGGEARVTQTQSAFGTPLYMSPEAVRSAKHTDARSDVWSFGVILYELLTGLPPFIADTPTGVAVAVTVDTPKPLRAARPDVSEAIDAVISRALEKDAARRYQNAAELRDALLAATGERTSVPPPADFDRSSLPAGARAVSQRMLATTPAVDAITAPARTDPKLKLIAIAGVAVVTAAVTVGVAMVVLSSRGSGPATSTAAPIATEPHAESTSPVVVERAVVPQLVTNPIASEAPSTMASSTMASSTMTSSAPASAAPIASGASAPSTSPSAVPAAPPQSSTPVVTVGTPPPQPPPPPPPLPNTSAGGNPRRL